MKIKETRIELILWIGFLTIIAGFLFGLLSCSSAEQLTECNYNDRLITGYSHNGKYFTVKDGCGNPAPKIKVSRFPNAKPGVFLISVDEFRLVKM